MTEAHLPESRDLAVARDAARAGGRVLSKYFRQGVEAREKNGEGLLTIADTEAEAAIAAIVRDAFPPDAILAEEQHRDDPIVDGVARERVWVVDPLDGTTNFAHGIAHFAVSVALWCDGRPSVGIVFDPIGEVWHEAVAGHGAFRDGERLRAAQTTDFRDALIATGFNYDRASTLSPTLDAIRDLMLAGIRGVRRFGTASLDLCLLASGSFSGFFECRLSPWDYAAGCLVASEAGAIVTRLDGSPLDLLSGSVLGATSGLHQPMIERLAGCRPMIAS